MWYLYALTHKNQPFYIGISQDPIKRFFQHASCNWGYGTTEHLNRIAEAGEIDTIGLLIIDHFIDKQTASTAEQGLIRFCAAMHYKLCNWDLNKSDNIMIVCKRDKSVRLKRRRWPSSILNSVKDYHQKNNAEYHHYRKLKETYFLCALSEQNTKP